MNFLRLATTVSDKEGAVKFLQERGILHNPRFCAKGHPMHLQLRDNGDRWRCNIRECRQEKSLRADTWIHPSKLSFRQVVLFIYCWAREYTSVKFCEDELDLSHTTVVDFNNFLREVCAESLMNNIPAIGGPGMNVELDETLFSRRKNHSGRVLPQQWVFGGICRESGECFLVMVDNRSAEVLLPLVQQYVRPGSTVITDQWRAYLGIPTLPGNYTHMTVNHSQNFVDPESGAHTQRIESTWHLAKARNKKQCGTNREMLNGYLCEFMWRKRLREKDAFEQILTDIAQYWPVK
jgi:transposase-like protein